MSGNNNIPNGVDEEKATVVKTDETAHEASAPGHRATDKSDQILLTILKANRGTDMGDQ